MMMIMMMSNTYNSGIIQTGSGIGCKTPYFNGGIGNGEGNSHSRSG